MTPPDTPPGSADRHEAARADGVEDLERPHRNEDEPEHHHHLHGDGKTMIGAMVAAVTLYEVAAMTVNRALDEPLLPTSTDLLGHLDVGEVYRFMTPHWLRTAALMAGGAVLGTLGVAGGVVGMTQLDTPEERKRKVKAIKRLAHKTTDVVTAAATEPST